METLWFPTDEDVVDILGSASAKRHRDHKEELRITQVRAGQKVRIAILQFGELRIGECQMFAAASDEDLSDLVEAQRSA
jgi:hypothetical protein